MDDDRAAMLATMYQNDEPATETPITIDSQFRTRKIRVGAIEYEVPSADYVRHLEQALQRQNQTLQQHRVLLDRLTALLGKARFAQGGQQRAMTDLRQQMSKKITLRDFGG